MKLVVLMDPVITLKPAKDSTIAMLSAAKKLDWSCAFCTVHDVFCLSGKVYANLNSIKVVNLKREPWYEITPLGVHLLSDFDIILMRKDPPFNIEYIYATYALELAEQTGVLVANKPQSLRDANEKFFTLNFPECCPPTLVSKNIDQLRDFWQKHRDVIFKPLAAMGGYSVFHVDKQGNNLSVILEVLTEHETVTIMAQSYLPAIKSIGDKRILLINGEPVPYALARLPASGEERGNLAAGARAEVVPLNARDHWICSQISNILRNKGLYFVGIDVIGDYLTEINVTSPTCIQEINRVTSLDIALDYLLCLEKIVLTKAKL